MEIEDFLPSTAWNCWGDTARYEVCRVLVRSARSKNRNGADTEFHQEQRRDIRKDSYTREEETRTRTKFRSSNSDCTQNQGFYGPWPLKALRDIYIVGALWRMLCLSHIVLNRTSCFPCFISLLSLHQVVYNFGIILSHMSPSDTLGCQCLQSLSKSIRTMNIFTMLT